MCVQRLAKIEANYKHSLRVMSHDHKAKLAQVVDLGSTRHWRRRVGQEGSRCTAAGISSDKESWARMPGASAAQAYLHAACSPPAARLRHWPLTTQPPLAEQARLQSGACALPGEG